MYRSVSVTSRLLTTMGQLCCKEGRIRTPRAEIPSPRPEVLQCQPEQIYNTSPQALDTAERLLDLSKTGTPCRIRLLDCQALANDDTLRIVEFSAFPDVPYAAISYPWRGIAVDSDFRGQTFAVKGAEHADPVGTDALRHACAAASLRGCPFLWLDRLCIMQDNKEDKHWQIRYMYQVYKSCRLCIVLAGGLQRLVRLDEETSWIHRSWTLQEVLAPPNVAVLLDWKLGPGKGRSGGTTASIDEVVANESVLAPLSLVLQACTTGTLSFAPQQPESTSTMMVEASIFSAHPSKHSYNDIPFWRPQRKVLAPNVIALTIAMDPVLSSDPDVRAHAVWQSALMRTSSRPVDMVFSIMGLFDVSLDLSRFQPHDRRAATIALAQEILGRGGVASWLGIGGRLEPDRSLSSFPVFPHTSVSGVALVETKKGMQEVSELVGPIYPISEALVALPKGEMDADGYLSLTARAVRLRPAVDQANGDGKVFEAFDGSHWAVRGDEELGGDDQEEPQTYAVLLGWYNKYYPGQTSASDTNNIRILLVQKHAEPNSFHVRSSLALHRREKAFVLDWPQQAFRLGGPAAPPPQADSSSEDPVQTYVERDGPWPRVPGNKPLVTIEHEVIRKARWAVPQRVLERDRKPQE
ncbi:hypothetical protein FKP32DRAFT_1665500 [Trametes sanguinea]|nr:hypothetical protein FKP32DRAFT_1665500 [Trametes sanguinea]